MFETGSLTEPGDYCSARLAVQWDSSGSFLPSAMITAECYVSQILMWIQTLVFMLL